MESNAAPLKGKEYLYTYRNSQQISSQTGLIGYLRADMGTLGTEFFSTWNGFRDDLNTQDFKDDIDTVINSFLIPSLTPSGRKAVFFPTVTSLKIFALTATKYSHIIQALITA